MATEAWTPVGQRGMRAVSFKLKPLQVTLIDRSESSRLNWSEAQCKRRVVDAFNAVGLTEEKKRLQSEEGHLILDGTWTLELSLAVRYDEFAPGTHGHKTQPNAHLSVLHLDGILRLTLPQESTAVARRYAHRTTAILPVDKAGFQAHVDVNLNDEVTSLARWVRSEIENFSRPPRVLVQKLQSDVTSADSSILERIAQLKHRPAVPGLVTLLKTSESSGLRLRVIGVLAEIGDEAAADGLIQIADPRNREEFSAILVAISTIGGQRTKDFLEIFAQHDAEDVRAMVEEASKRLQRRHGTPDGVKVRSK